MSATDSGIALGTEDAAVTEALFLEPNAPSCKRFGKSDPMVFDATAVIVE